MKQQLTMPGMWNQIPLPFFDLITSRYNITIKIHPYKLLLHCPDVQTALDGFVMGDLGKEYLLELMKKLSKVIGYIR